MRLLALFAGATAVATAAAAQTQSPKRGLAFTPNDGFPEDNEIWARKESGLTWYYNFNWNVSEEYASVPQAQFEFVPMMWGGNDGNDTFFLGNVTEMMKKTGRNISHVLGFNTPDMPFTSGGSEMLPAIAAKAWVLNILPLREEHGIKVGLPVMGSDSNAHDWLDPFLANCTKVNKKKPCGFDFVTLHSFGDFEVLKKRVDMWAKASVYFFPSTDKKMGSEEPRLT